MPAKFLYTTFALFSLTYSSFALVDYTEEESFAPKNSGASRVRKPSPSPAPQVQTSVTKPRVEGRAPSGMFNTGVMYGSQDVELEGITGKVDTMSFEAHFQTRYNIFMGLDYYQAKSTSGNFGNNGSSFQKGNPEVKLGFNWLQFGGAGEQATIDLYGGLSVGQDGSDFATVRDDKLLGVTTAKRFYNFALGLGYEVRLTGGSGEQELDIGNISRLSASLGWVASPDIRFLVEGSTYNIGRGGDSGLNRLGEDAKFSTVSPKLQLRLSSMFDLTLGAHFRTRRLKEATLVGAKLWNLDAAYGNVIFAGLAVNI